MASALAREHAEVLNTRSVTKELTRSGSLSVLDPALWFGSVRFSRPTDVMKCYRKEFGCGCSLRISEIQSLTGISGMLRHTKHRSSDGLHVGRVCPSLSESVRVVQC
ncbi:hypothetical protein FQA47_021028 [Oryzias melastigma]|uniref:Uncharacterized protein n=1 Tax=Oryzias melastigma TaxID=30732 RepID=A0A834CP11_ORYME|nr:hypothetical protein FQA47_021028 [Oryzias melastigma]